MIATRARSGSVHPAALTCPSSDCSTGNLLIGVVQRDGTVSRVQPPLEVDDHFVRRAEESSQHPPEARFRFAGPCVTTSCQQWTGSRCAVGDLVANATPDVEALQPCAIRATCRWWSQNGPRACTSCSLVAHSRPDCG
jgi:hypothetical protein